MRVVCEDNNDCVVYHYYRNYPSFCRCCHQLSNNPNHTQDVTNHLPFEYNPQACVDQMLSILDTMSGHRVWNLHLLQFQGMIWHYSHVSHPLVLVVVVVVVVLFVFLVSDSQ